MIGNSGGQGTIVNDFFSQEDWMPTLLAAAGEPDIVEKVKMRWYADNIWLFVPVQQKLKAFLLSLPDYPFRQGSSLNAPNIDYSPLQAMEAMKQLQQLESLAPPSN